MIPTILNGIQTASKEISVISHNLANAGTTGFKRSRSEFVDTYGIGAEQPPNIDLGHGARSLGPKANFSQGQVKPSLSELDVAISGVGMFATLKRVDPGQDAFGYDNQLTFTRDGSFRLDNDGTLVTMDGRAVIGADGQAMVVPLARADADGNAQRLTALNIGEDGRFEATYGDGSVVDLEQIGLFDFVNMAGLKGMGNGHFQVSAASGPPLIGRPAENNFGRVLAGNLETANINVTNELTKMMKAQQAYSGSARLLQAATDMTKRLID